MKKSHEQKNNIIQRLFTSTLKLTKTNTDARSKSPTYKYKYELPNSFLKAVNTARTKAGYNVLPSPPRQSASPSTSSSSSSTHDSYKHLQTVSDIFRSSSHNDIDRIPTRKIAFRRKPREQVQQHRHATAPVLLPPRPTFRMMMPPNAMMMNRCRRPLPIVPMHSTLRMPQQRQIFRMPFR